MFHAIMPRTWSVFGLAVVRAGDCLQRDFDATFSYRDAETLKAYRILWAKLRALSEAPGTCWSVTTLHYLLYCSVTLLITAFGVMAALQQGYLTARGQTLVNLHLCLGSNRIVANLFSTSFFFLNGNYLSECY